jgi:hypothetical protein
MNPTTDFKPDSMAVFAEWIKNNPKGGIIKLEGIKIKVTPK